MASRLMIDFEDFYVSLGKVYASIQQAVHQIVQENQLSISHLQVLLVLNRIKGKREWVPLKELYPYFRITQPAIGRLVRYLAYWDYVEIKRDEEDRRRILLRILPAGKTLLYRFRQASAEALDDPTLALLQRSLQRLSKLKFAPSREIPAE